MSKLVLWTSAWIFMAVWFLVWEFTALIIRRPDLTLSDLVWRLEGAGWTFGRYVVFAMMVWLTFHFVWHMFR